MIFAQRFWGDGSGNELCLDASDFTTVLDVAMCGVGSPNRTLKELNFAMMFALGIMAYEATLVTDETIVDLLAGGIIPPGTLITNTLRNQSVTVDIGAPFDPPGNAVGLPNTGHSLEECIAAVALNASAAQEDIATDLCLLEFARFIDVRAEAGTEAGDGPFQPVAADGTLVPIEAGEAIGGCDIGFTGALGLLSPDYPRICQVAQAELLNIDEGLGRFEAGATACTVCHFDPIFTGASVAANYGFGAPPPDPNIPPGQLLREEAPALTERMIAFNGQTVVYDAGFYNLGVRPTWEDLGRGAPINVTEGTIPLSLAKLKEQIALGLGNAQAPFNPDVIDGIAATLDAGTGPGMLQLPTSMAVNGVGEDDLTAVPFDITLACGPGLVGNGNGQGEPNNNPNPNCVLDVIPGEFILRNGAIKTQGLRDVRWTAPMFHTGSKMNSRQVFEFYKAAGALDPDPSLGFPNLNLGNLDAGLRVINLSPEREAAVVELLETGLTDWPSVYESAEFDHPELCVSHGHDPASGVTVIVGLPAVGSAGNQDRIQTFQENLQGITGQHEHDFDLSDPGNLCTVPGIDDNANFLMDDVITDVPPMEP